MRANTQETQRFCVALKRVTGEMVERANRGEMKRNEICDVFCDLITKEMRYVPEDTGEDVTDEVIDEMVNNMVL